METKPDGIKVAQGSFDKQHVLRVVFRRDGGGIKVITFHPGDRGRYEKK
ncbi:MAG: hypothetical protein HYV03_05235 [Deltaproteobacteria bacterium]|nr:hypothetical protein [Deltaproteobacteria bacterium]